MTIEKNEIIIENATALVGIDLELKEHLKLKIEDGIISVAGAGLSSRNSHKIDASGYLLIPGFINSIIDSNKCKLEDCVYTAVISGSTSIQVDSAQSMPQYLLNELIILRNNNEMNSNQSPQSCDNCPNSINLWKELKKSYYRQLQTPEISMRNTLQMFTSKAARNLELVNTGVLDDGFYADIIFLYIGDLEHRSLSEIFNYVFETESELSRIHAVMKRGKFIHSLYHSKFTTAPYFSDSLSAVKDLNETFTFDTIESAIEDIKMGEFIIVVDNEDRENEGDLIIAAQDMTTEKAAFMIRYTSGVICVPATSSRLEELDLPLMVAKNTDSMKTAYSITTDFKHGTTTGISAKDRATTIRELANPLSMKDDFNRPGHVFPLCYNNGGVLARQGHTEAGVDFCKLAGKFPVAAISEITLDNGEMARRNDLFPFAKKWNIKIVKISDLVLYRQRLINESLL